MIREVTKDDVDLLDLVYNRDRVDLNKLSPVSADNLTKEIIEKVLNREDIKGLYEDNEDVEVFILYKFNTELQVWNIFQFFKVFKGEITSTKQELHQQSIPVYCDLIEFIIDNDGNYPVRTYHLWGRNLEANIIRTIKMTERGIKEDRSEEGHITFYKEQ